MRRPAYVLGTGLALAGLVLAWFLALDRRPPRASPVLQPREEAGPGEGVADARATARAPLAALDPPIEPDPGPARSAAPATSASGTLRGRVVGGSAEVLGRLEVQATALDGEEPARSARCDAQGRFQLDGLAPQTTYHLRGFVAGRAGFGRSRTEVRTARAGDGEVELALLPEPALVFQVVDARSGLALTDFEVRLGRGFARPLLDEQGRVRQAFPEGQVRWVSWVPEEAREGVELDVSARGYRELRRGDVLPPRESDLDLGRLLLEPVPRLIVRVQDAQTRSAIRGAAVSLEAEDEGARPPASAAFDPYSGLTDEEGRVLLTSLPGQEVLLRVWHLEYLDLERTLALGLAEQQVETVALAHR